MSELQDLVALIRANTPLIVIETRDEAAWSSCSGRH
jgi:hypothetical protein